MTSSTGRNSTTISPNGCAVVRVTAAGRPVVLYAHSLGGLISAGYLLSERPKPDVAVLTGPALGDTVPAWKRRLIGQLVKVVPTFGLNNDFDGATLSRDPTVAARTIDDPSCVKVSTARLAAAGFAEQDRVRAGVGAGFGIPVLVLHGTDDGLVPASASEVLGTAPLVERRTYPGLRHELHNEPEGASIVDEIIVWLRDRLAGAR